MNRYATESPLRQAQGRADKRKPFVVSSSNHERETLSYFTVPSPDYSLTRAIEDRALREIQAQPEADPPLAEMGLWLGAACKLNLWGDRLEKIEATSQAPQTALKLFVSVPWLLQAQPSIDTLS